MDKVRSIKCVRQVGVIRMGLIDLSSKVINVLPIQRPVLLFHGRHLIGGGVDGW